MPSPRGLRPHAGPPATGRTGHALLDAANLTADLVQAPFVKIGAMAANVLGYRAAMYQVPEPPRLGPVR